MRFGRFLYNIEGNEGAGGVGNEAPPTTPIVNEPAQPEATQIPLSELEALGFKSIDELRAHFNKPAEPSEEEKAHQEQLKKADFLKFGTENNLITIDDYQQFESVKAKADKDLVFDNFSKEFIEDNPDADDYEIEQAFNLQYHIDSDNATLKKRGEKLLQKDATELRSPIQSKYETAWNEFSTKKELEQKIPVWNKLIDETVGKVVPEKMKVFEKDIDGKKVAIEIDLTTADREEIASKFKMNVRAYDLFAKGKTDELNSTLTKKINGYIQEKYSEQIREKVFEQGLLVGKTKGSNIGATAPFPMVNNQAVVIPMEQNKLDEIRKSHAEAAAIRK
jgi:hypothetical protein